MTRYLLFTLLFFTFSINCNADDKEVNKSDVFKCKNRILPQSAFVKTTRGKEVVEPDGLISREDTNKLVNTKNKCFRITGSELIYLIKTTPDFLPAKILQIKLFNNNHIRYFAGKTFAVFISIFSNTLNNAFKLSSWSW